MSDRGRLRPSSGGADGARISDSPRRSPRITHSVTSPVRSVHPEQMESLDSQADFGMRTLDFFDQPSSDEETVEHDSGPEGDGTTTPAQWRKKKLESDGYEQLSPARDTTDTSRFSAETPSTDFNGSVDELLGEQHPSIPPEYPRAARLSGRSLLQRPRSSMIEPRSEPAQRSSSVMPMSSTSHNAASKLDQVLSAHAIAHEITLHALMRDEEALDRSLQTFAPMHTGERGSLLPASLRFNDPRSPTTLRNFSTPTGQAARTSVPSTAKRVTLIPPRIDTTAKEAPRQSLPPDMVRTPYPFSPPQETHRKDLNTLHPPPTPHPPSAAPHDSILTLSIRRSNCHSKTRVTTLTTPTADPTSSPHLPSRKSRTSLFFQPKTFPGSGLDYDDESLFLALRASYASLTGPWRYLSARTLSRIQVSGSASKAADAGYGWLAAPRSPRTLAHGGLSDTFGEEKILELFRKPRGGRRRFAFVEWAHRVAGAEVLQGGEGAGTTVPPFAHLGSATFGFDSPAPGTSFGRPSLTTRAPQPEGLEFVLAWSLRRIASALALVLLASAAATLCWVLLGRSSTMGLSSTEHGGLIVGSSSAGFRGAGDRVAGGVAMGIGVLLLGLTGMAGWLGVSGSIM